MQSPAHIQKVSDSGSSRVRKRPVIQADLEVGKPGDKYEQEADAVAQRVMMQPSMEEEEAVQMQPAEEEEAVQMETVGEEEEMAQMESAGEEEEMVQMASPVEEEERVQMAVVNEEEAVQMQAEEEEAVQMERVGEEEGALQMEAEDEEEMIQRSPAPVIQRVGSGGRKASADLASRINSAKGGGDSMEIGLQREMEHKMGADFSGVNIHTGSSSVQMNRELGAKAFTVGNDIHFNQGQYDPHSSKGKRLLAHELTHVVQQNSKSRQKYDKKTEQATKDLSRHKLMQSPIMLQFDRLEDYNVWPVTRGKAMRIWLGAVPDLVYEQANYRNEIGWREPGFLWPALTSNAYEYITRLTPFRNEIARWDGTPDANTTTITTDKLKEAPPHGFGSIYRHAFGTSAGAYAAIKAYTDFNVKRVVQGSTYIGTRTVPDYRNVIPIQSNGQTEITFEATTSTGLTEGYSVSRSEGREDYLSSEITSNVGADIGPIAASIESSVEAKETITQAVSDNESFSKNKTESSGIKVIIPATSEPINMLVIPKYGIVTLKLDLLSFDSNGKITGTYARYVHHIAPTGQYDLTDAEGHTDVRPKSFPTKSAREAYVKTVVEDLLRSLGLLSFEPIDANSVVHSFRKESTHEAARNYADQVRITGDGLNEAGKSIELEVSSEEAVTVQNGRTFSQSSSVSNEINASVKSEIGLSEAASKSSGVQASVGGKISSGEQITQSIDRAIVDSRTTSITIADTRKVLVPPFKKLSLYLTPLVRITTYKVMLINGEIIYVHTYKHHPTRHSYVHVTEKGVYHPETMREV